jgi:hypothetical protein
VAMTLEPTLRASLPASSITRRARGVMAAVSLRGRPSPRPTISSTCWRIPSSVAPNSERTLLAVPPSRMRPSSRCSGPIMAWPSFEPSSRAKWNTRRARSS